MSQIIKMKTTEVYKHRGLVLDAFKRNETGVILILAPTGSGKTTGVRQLASDSPDFFGKTWMVQPTRMASRASQNGTVHVMTPHQILESFFRHRSFPCRTLIIDEIHSRSVEYDTLLMIIKREALYEHHRIVLVSATANMDHLYKFFPEIDVVDIPIPTPHSIEIEYDSSLNLQYGYSVSYRNLLPLVRHAISRNPGHNRVLVFVSTHEQCDRLASALVNIAPTRALYGGMVEEEYQEWRSFVERVPCFIVIATNVAETSITIPGVSLIIDFGLKCIMDHGRVVHRPCSRSNLIQRAGRTGRTCPGKVIRFMTEDDFNARPFQDEPKHDFSILVLRMLRHRFDPVSVYGDAVDTETIVAGFRQKKILGDDGTVDERLASFVVSSPLLLKHSCLLYDFLNRRRDETEPKILLYILCISIIDAFESRMCRIYYHSPDLKMSRARFLAHLTRKFCPDKLLVDNNVIDELELTLNIFLSCIMSDNPLAFSNAFSLNYRTVRQARSHMNHVVSFLQRNHYISPSILWKDAIASSGLLSAIERRMIIPSRDHASMEVLLIKEKSPVMEGVREIFFRQSVPFLLQNDFTLYHDHVYHSGHCIIPPQRAHMILYFPIEYTPDPNETTFLLYTRAPAPVYRHIDRLILGIEGEYNRRVRIRRKIQTNKRHFQRCMEDIREDIAYRPHAWKMLESIEDCLACIHG